MTYEPAKWLKENGDKLIHFGSSVDLSINATKAMFETAKFRTRKVKRTHCDYNTLQILLNEKWLTVARTDLKDDVCTVWCETKSLKEWKDYYASRIAYGARIKEKTFAVVDSVSDG